MNCTVCEKELSGAKTKFCSLTCQRYLAAKKDKALYRKSNPLLPKRKCLSCKKEFQPRQDNHTCCNADCRHNYLIELRRDTKPQTIFPKWWIPLATTFKNPPKLIRLTTANSTHKNEIESFLKDGGKVVLLPAQLDGRTPDVNLKSKYGWASDTFMGFGFEIELMDQLIETMGSNEL